MEPDLYIFFGLRPFLHAIMPETVASLVKRRAIPKRKITIDLKKFSETLCIDELKALYKTISKLKVEVSVWDEKINDIFTDDETMEKEFDAELVKQSDYHFTWVSVVL